MLQINTDNRQGFYTCDKAKFKNISSILKFYQQLMYVINNIYNYRYILKIVILPHHVKLDVIGP